MKDEVLTAAFQRLSLSKTALAEVLGPDWRVDGDLITDDRPGGIYQVKGNEIYLTNPTREAIQWVNYPSATATEDSFPSRLQLAKARHETTAKRNSANAATNLVTGASMAGTKR